MLHNPNKKLVLSMEYVSTHTFHLAQYLHNSLRALKHANGQNVIELYPNTFSDKEYQSGIVTFNVKDANGDYVGYAQVKNLILKLLISFFKRNVSSSGGKKPCSS